MLLTVESQCHSNKSDCQDTVTVGLSRLSVRPFVNGGPAILEAVSGVPKHINAYPLRRQTSGNRERRQHRQTTIIRSHET